MNNIDITNSHPQKCYNLWTKEEENGIISNYSNIYTLNETAFYIWQLINGTKTVNDIINNIVDKYSVSHNVATDDCCNILKYLHNNNLSIIDYDPIFKLGTTNKNINHSLYERYVVRNTDEKDIDILLLTPPSPKYEANILEKNYSAFPLGIGYLLSALKKNSTVKYNYLNLWSQIFTAEQIIDLLNTIKPKVIGISCMTENYLNGIRLIKYFKKNTNYPFIAIAGGPHISLCYKDVLKENCIDYCFIGESENSLVEFMAKLKEGKEINNVGGIAYLNNQGELYCNPINTNDMPDSLDMLDFPIIDNRTDFGKHFVTISGSRGCPFSCKFCAAGKLSGRKYRFRSISNIIDEIWLHYNNGINNFGFIDDTITAIPERMKELCENLKKRKIDIIWNAESRVDVAAKDKNMLREMHSCGCKVLQFGIEAGSDTKLRKIKKGTTISQIKKALDNAFDVGIQISGSMIVGLPNESEESIIKTFEFAEELQNNYPLNIVIGWFVPYPGTEYRDELINDNMEGFNLSNYDTFTTLHPNYNVFDEKFFKYQNIYFSHMVKIMKKNTSLLKDIDLNIGFFDDKNEYF